MHSLVELVEVVEATQDWQGKTSSRYALPAVEVILIVHLED